MFVKLITCSNCSNRSFYSLCWQWWFWLQSKLVCLCIVCVGADSTLLLSVPKKKLFAIWCWSTSGKNPIKFLDANGCTVWTHLVLKDTCAQYELQFTYEHLMSSDDWWILGVDSSVRMLEHQIESFYELFIQIISFWVTNCTLLQIWKRRMCPLTNAMGFTTFFKNFLNISRLCLYLSD